MKAVCGVDIDKDKMFVSLASLKNSKINFLEEMEVKASFQKEGLLDFLKDNLGVLDRHIKKKETDYSLNVDRIYLKLPWGEETMRVVEDVIPLKRNKRIDPKDISYAKKYMEDVILDWDDFCLHHFVTDYEIDGVKYKAPPIGVWAKSMRIKSLLFTVKDKLRRDAHDIFYNFDRVFGGFVSSAVSAFSSAFEDNDKKVSRVVVSVGYDGTYVVVIHKGCIELVKAFGFGIKKIIQILEKELDISFNLAEEIFNRYVYFKDMPFLSEESSAGGMPDTGKEIRVKNGDLYINLGVHSLNTIIKKYITDEIGTIMAEVNDRLVKEESTVSFIGRLNKKEGFYEFLRRSIPYNMKISPFEITASSSLGCLRYGTFRFLENNHKRQGSVFVRVSDIYREYF